MRSTNLKIKDLQQRAQKLLNDFSTRRWHYQEISEVMETRKSRFLIDYDSPEQLEMGLRSDQKIMNSSTLYAVNVARAGFTHGLTPSSRDFIGLTIPDKDLAKWGRAREYLDMLRDWVMKTYALSNYYNAKSKFWGSGIVYGIANQFQYYNAPTNAMFDPYEIGEYQLARGKNGEIDTSYRKFSKTVGNIVHEFGYENCSEAVQKCFTNKEVDKRFMINHIIQPNDYFNPFSHERDGMKYESVYFEDKATQPEDNYLLIEGFRSKPFSPFCWDADGNQPYGNSQGAIGLGDANVLQAVEELNWEGLVLAQKPAMQYPATTEIDLIDFSPNAMNSYNPGTGSHKIEPLVAFKPDHQGILIEIDRIKARFSKIMYNNLFLSLMNSGQKDPQKTAYEIAEKQRETLLMLSSATEAGIGSIKADVTRTLGIGWDRNLLPPPPEELAGMELEVTCVGTLALAQKAVDIQAIQRLSGYVGSLMNMYPGEPIAQKLNAEYCIEKFAEAEGLPTKALKSESTYKALVEYNQQAEAMAQKNMQAQQMADTAKTMSDTHLEQGDSALDQLLKQTGNSEND